MLSVLAFATLAFGADSTPDLAKRLFRDCSDARECGECNSFCDNSSDREDCLDDFNCQGGDSGAGKRCDDAEKCGDCKKWCSGSEKKDCKKDLCDRRRAFDNGYNSMHGGRSRRADRDCDDATSC